jgi:hypothetical protein
MMKEPYFHWRQLLIIQLIALVGSYFFSSSPLRDISWPGPIFPVPASGLALYGGIFFVFWIYLSRQIIDLKYTEIVAAVFLASMTLVFNPGYLTEDYGVLLPVVIYVLRYVGILAIGIVLHFTGPGFPKHSLLGGGLGNLICAGLIWGAFNFKAVCGYPWLKWLTPASITVYALVAVASGMVGVLLAHLVGRGIKVLTAKYNKLLITKCKNSTSET